MTDAIELISANADLPERFLIIANEQTVGIGRNPNKWYSPPDGLWFTYGISAEGVSHQITLFIGYCLHKYLVKNYPLLRDRLKIKWPNDLMIGNNKLSGTLVQTYQGYLLIGIGLNTNNDIVRIDTFFKPTGLIQLHNFEISNSSILRGFLAEFNHNFSDFSNKGLLPFKEYINHHTFGIGKHISFDPGSGIVDCLCRGISDDGALNLENMDGAVSKYYSGSILSIRG